MLSLAIIGLFAIILFILAIIFAFEGPQKNTYQESLVCFGISIVLSLIVFDVLTTIDDVNNKTRTQAIEYGYAKYEVDSKGKTKFMWIVPTPQPKVEPVKPEPVVIEKN